MKLVGGDVWLEDATPILNEGQSLAKWSSLLQTINQISSLLYLFLFSSCNCFVKADNCDYTCANSEVTLVKGLGVTPAWVTPRYSFINTILMACIRASLCEVHLCCINGIRSMATTPGETILYVGFRGWDTLSCRTELGTIGRTPMHFHQPSSLFL